MQPAHHAWPVWVVLLVKALELGYELSRPVEEARECGGAVTLSARAREELVEDLVYRLSAWERRRRTGPPRRRTAEAESENAEVPRGEPERPTAPRSASWEAQTAYGLYLWLGPLLSSVPSWILLVLGRRERVPVREVNRPALERTQEENGVPAVAAPRPSRPARRGGGVLC